MGTIDLVKKIQEKNQISNENALKLIMLINEAEKLGFEYDEYDGMDGFFYIKFAIADPNCGNEV